MFLAVDSEGTRLDVRQLLSPLPHVSVVTVIDILLVAVIIYEFLAIIRGTRAALMVVGVAALALAFYFARIGELTTLNWLISTLLPYAVFALIVVFQGELRQALARLGRKLTFRSAMSSEADAYDDIVLAANLFLQNQTGALIVIERDVTVEELRTRLSSLLHRYVPPTTLPTPIAAGVENGLVDESVRASSSRSQDPNLRSGMDH